MFNFFSELASDYGLEIGALNTFNVVNLSNKLVYVEGQKGVIAISDKEITLRVKKGVISVVGENLKIKRITSQTMVIVGKIKQIESNI